MTCDSDDLVTLTQQSGGQAAAENSAGPGDGDSHGPTRRRSETPR